MARNMVQYLQFRILEFPLTGEWDFNVIITHHGSMVLVEKCVYMTGVFVDGIHGTPFFSSTVRIRHGKWFS